MLEWCNEEVLCIAALALVVVCLLAIIWKKNLQINQTINTSPPKETVKEIRYEKVTFPILIKIAIPVTVLSASVTLFSIKFDIGCPNIRKPEPSDEKQFLYDTSRQNNRYIVGNLESSQLSLLDKLLLFEKKKCGNRLKKEDVRKFSNGDIAIENAYTRWRECKNLRRSSGSIIYPDERDYFIKTFKAEIPNKP